MYKVKTEPEFDAAHCVSGYTGKCSKLQGPIWAVEG